MAEGDDGAEGVAGAVAEVFAVEGEAFGEEVAVFLKPGVEGLAEEGGVEDVEEVVEGVVAGEFEAAGFVTLVEADGGALLLVERAAFSPNAFDVGGAADEAVGEEAEHGAEGVAAAFGVAEVIDVFEGGAQAAELAGAQGAAGSGGGLGDGFLVDFGELPGVGEEGAGVFLKGADPEVFGAFGVEVEVATVALEAFGEAEGGPVGGFVKGAGVVGGVVEAFGEEGAVLVLFFPFVLEGAQAEAEALAGEIGLALVFDDESQSIQRSLSRRAQAAPAQQKTATRVWVPLSGS